MKELIVGFPSAKRTAGWCKAVRTVNKSRSGVWRRKSVSRHGLLRYHGKRFSRTSPSGFTHINQSGWYRDIFVPEAVWLQGLFYLFDWSLLRSPLQNCTTSSHCLFAQKILKYTKYFCAFVHKNAVQISGTLLQQFT